MTTCLPAGTVVLIALPPLAFIVAVVVFWFTTTGED